MDDDTKKPHQVVTINEVPPETTIDSLNRGVCPECGGTKFLQGPGAGDNRNIECKECGTDFNVFPDEGPPFLRAERIGWNNSGRKQPEPRPVSAENWNCIHCGVAISYDTVKHIWLDGRFSQHCGGKLNTRHNAEFVPAGAKTEKQDKQPLIPEDLLVRHTFYKHLSSSQSQLIVFLIERIGRTESELARLRELVRQVSSHGVAASYLPPGLYTTLANAAKEEPKP